MKSKTILLVAVLTFVTIAISSCSSSKSQSSNSDSKHFIDSVSATINERAKEKLAISNTCVQSGNWCNYSPTRQLMAVNADGFQFFLQPTLTLVKEKLRDGKNEMGLINILAKLTYVLLPEVEQEFNKYKCDIKKCVLTLEDGSKIEFMNDDGKCVCGGSISSKTDEGAILKLANSKLKTVSFISETKNWTCSFDIPEGDRGYFVQILSDVGDINSGKLQFGSTIFAEN